MYFFLYVSVDFLWLLASSSKHHCLSNEHKNEIKFETRERKDEKVQLTFYWKNLINFFTLLINVRS